MNTKKMSLNLSNFIFLLGMASCLIGCHDNQICFDIDKQVLFTTSDNPLSNFYIEEISGDLVLIQAKKDRAESHYDFSIIDTINYSYEKLGKNRKMIKNYFLKPHSTYNIKNSSYGEAANGKLIFETDATGNVIKSNSECNFDG